MMFVSDCFTLEHTPLVWPGGNTGRTGVLHNWRRTSPDGGVFQIDLWLYRDSRRMNAVQARADEFQTQTDDDPPSVAEELQAWIRRSGDDVQDGAVLTLRSVRNEARRILRWDIHRRE